MDNSIVPDYWAEFAFEFKLGYEEGLRLTRRWCPIKGKGESPNGREAWKAGYQAGRKVTMEAIKHLPKVKGGNDAPIAE